MHQRRSHQQAANLSEWDDSETFKSESVQIPSAAHLSESDETFGSESVQIPSKLPNSGQIYCQQTVEHPQTGPQLRQTWSLAEVNRQQYCGLPIQEDYSYGHSPLDSHHSSVSEESNPGVATLMPIEASELTSQVETLETVHSNLSTDSYFNTIGQSTQSSRMDNKTLKTKPRGMRSNPTH